MDGLWLASYVALWVLVLLLVVLLLGLAREIGGIQARVGPPGVLVTEDGIEIGDEVPDFRAIAIPGGREVAFRAASGRNALLVFISPNCEPCRRLLPAVMNGWVAWQRQVDVHLVCEGNEKEVSAFAKKARAEVSLLTDPGSEIHEAFGRPPRPFAYLIGAQGTVKLKGTVSSGDDIDRLVEGRARAIGGRELVASLETLPSDQDTDEAARSPVTPAGVAYGRADGATLG